MIGVKNHLYLISIQIGYVLSNHGNPDFIISFSPDTGINVFRGNSRVIIVRRVIKVKRAARR